MVEHKKKMARHIAIPSQKKKKKKLAKITWEGQDNIVKFNVLRAYLETKHLSNIQFPSSSLHMLSLEPYTRI